jgi:signal transduction histidine kinase
MTSGAVHDFRNVLQTIASSLELIEQLSGDPDAVRRLAASALRASDRGTSLARRLLSVARQEEPTVATVDLLPSVTDVAETLTGTVGRNVKLEIETGGGLWQAAIDPHEFELALINLGINARDAMPDGGSIRFRTRNVTLPAEDRRRPVAAAPRQDRRGPPLLLPGGDYVAVAVADTGFGMDEATLARAVKPFFTTKPRGQGTGLGLAMVQSFAARSGGTLRLISKPGSGTVAELWLPRAADGTAEG